jgi:hypothetical protein
MTQRGYSRSTTRQELVGEVELNRNLERTFEEETGLPTFPVIQTIGAPFKATARSN